MSELSNPGRNGGRLKRLPKGISGNPNGRPPKLLNTLLADLRKAGYERVGASTVVEAFEVMMNLPQEEVTRMVKDEKMPMSARIVGKAMLSSKGWEVLQAMMDRAHGRAKQQVDMAASVSGSVPTIMVQVLPPSQNAGG